MTFRFSPLLSGRKTTFRFLHLLRYFRDPLLRSLKRFLDRINRHCRREAFLRMLNLVSVRSSSLSI
jgi:hypothetical protein